MGKIVSITDKEAKKYFKSQKHNDAVKKIKNIKDDDIDFSDIPEITDEFIKKEKKNQQIKKDRIFIKLDHDVLDFFKNNGKNIEIFINSALRDYIENNKK